MGMPVSIHVRAADPGRLDIQAAVANAYAHLRHVDAVLSPWRRDSDLLRVRRGELETASAHPWLAEVTALAARAESVTDGLFTTVLTGPDGTTGFDPTGLAKGWAVEGSSAYLQVVDRISFCINAGGDLTIGMGRNLAGSASTWRIGIQDPGDPMATVNVVEVSDGAVASSGGSARGAHVIDPRTGRAIDRPGSVTVIGPDLVWADVWATAAWVDPCEATRLMAVSHPAYRLVRHLSGSSAVNRADAGRESLSRVRSRSTAKPAAWREQRPSP
jgi:thiamine biosynthesis lipoprotein